MEKLIKRYKDQRIALKGNELLDPLTGEFINIGNSTLFKRSSTGEITINSKEYVYVDSLNLRKILESGIKQVDLALLFTLSNNLLIKYNVCLDKNGNPLTTTAIAELINNSVQNTKRKLNRLKSQGLILHKKSNKHGKVYFLNPYIIRKGRKLNSSLRMLFDDI